ncbi:hypothetical protein [Sulfuriferula nivalis]|uniref:Uncharacterized protein n=1 Tax=Sulfuriferula nivalis TaxID=2675298 RepID=A0A809RLI4_9PROT|nr:hypothetical protein [Sulfuriferula nivalis]BBP01664.1 hypothetical protein SFSGTM_23720 [Sulfuriferula nivalis]
MHMKKVILSNVFSYLSVILSAQITYADEPTLCEADEKIILSCPVEGKKRKIISICAKNTVDGKDLSYIEYRFGTQKNTEMKYLVTRDNGAKMYRGLDNGTYSVYFAFQKYDYYYLVDVMQEVIGAQMSVTVTKKSTGADVAAILCKPNNWVENKNIKTSLLTEVDGRYLIEGEIRPPEK